MDFYRRSSPRSQTVRYCRRHPDEPVKVVNEMFICQVCTDGNYNEIEKDSDGKVIDPWAGEELTQNSVSRQRFLLG